METPAGEGWLALVGKRKKRREGKGRYFVCCEYVHGRESWEVVMRGILMFAVLLVRD